MKRKILSTVLSLSMILALPYQVSAVGTQGQSHEMTSSAAAETPQTEPAQKGNESEEIARLEVCTSIGADSGEAVVRNMQLDLTGSDTEIVLGEEENYLTLTAFDLDGNVLSAEKDFSIQTEVGEQIKFTQTGSGITIKPQAIAVDEIQVYNASGTEAAVIALSDEDDSTEEGEPTFADDITYTDILPDEEKDVVITEGAKQYFRFIPEETGVYNIYSSDCIGDPIGHLYDEAGNFLASDDDGNEGYNFLISTELDAGNIYFIEASSYNDEDSYKLHITKKATLSESVSYEDISINEEKNVVIEGGMVQYYRFIPEYEGEYYIYSSGCENDPYGTLYDDASNQLLSNDDGGSGVNFAINAYLEAGKIYFIAASSLDDSDSYTLCVVKKLGFSDIAPNAVQLEIASGESQSAETSIATDTQNIGYYDQLISFTPSQNGYYTFSVTLNNGGYLSSSPVILDDEGEMLADLNTDMNWLDEACQYFVSGKLEANKSYYAAISYSDGSDLECNAFVRKEAEITAVEINLKSPESALIYGKGGYWDDYYDSEAGEYITYYVFYTNDILSLYDISLKTSDGSEAQWNAQSNRVSVQTNQQENPWTVRGDNNWLTITADDASAQVCVPVIGFDENYRNCPEIQIDTAASVSYSVSNENSGVFLFTPKKDGIYNIYSTGGADTYIEIYDENANQLISDDDSYDGANFLVSYELSSDTVYIIMTRTYSGSDGAYQVIVTDKPVANDSYSSLEGKDLSGKYINLALVVDTTGSMSDIISNVRNTLNEFVDAIAQTNATLRIALIDYKDIIEDGNDSTVLHYGPTLSIWFENEDIEALKTQIGQLDADGGGDDPESAIDALGNLVDPDIMTFNAAAAKFAFLVTDASYKEENNHGIADMAEMIRLLKEKGIATSVITRKDNYGYYQSLAAETGGKLINVEDNFSKAMGRFAASIVEGAEDYIPDDHIVPVESISLGDDLTVPAGKVRNFRPVFTPANASEQGVLWEVADETIAEISPKTTDGILVVRGIREGTTDIIARSKDGGYTASFQFTVTKSVITDTKLESCDIDDLLAELENEDSSVDELIYYGDETSEVEDEKQTAVYHAIQQTEKNVAFFYSDDYGDLLYQWKFNGNEITNPDIAVAFGISINQFASAAKNAAAKMNIAKYATFDFSHEGSIPGRADITASVGNTYENGTYDLYYYNPVTQKLEACDTKATVENGIVSFEITHCSSYVIGKGTVSNITDTTEKPEDSSDKNTTDKDSSVNTTQNTTNNTTQNTANNTTSIPKKGAVLTVGKNSYKVTKAGEAAAFYKTTSKAASLSIPAKIKVNGITYKVTSIAANALKNNKNLKKVTIGKNVTVIGNNAFSGCKKLTTVTIGAGVTKIGKKAFYGDSKLAAVTIKSTKLKTIGANAFKGMKSTAKIVVPAKKLSSYKKILKGKGQGSNVAIKK